MIQLCMQTVVAGLIRVGGKILIAQRSSSRAHPLQWEFPGGKVEPGETEVFALVRELREELGIEARIGAEFARYEYIYPGKTAILLVFFEVASYVGEIQNKVGSALLTWEHPTHLPGYNFLEGDLPLIQLLGEIDVDQVE